MRWFENPRFLFKSILFIFALKILLAFLFPLTSDEGYYWLWSRHLAFTYVDHPPMIALINGLLQKIFWEPLLALRAGALIFNILIGWVLFEISKELFGNKNNQNSLHLRNLLLFFLIPNTLVIWLVLTVELPFVLFYLLAVLSFTKALSSPPVPQRVRRRGSSFQQDRYLIITGIFVGLGLSLTKYTMVLIYPAILIFVIMNAHSRYLLRKVNFWLSGALGLLIFSPVFILNLLQKGESFGFHLQRVGRVPWFAETGTFIGEQLLYLSPFLAYFILRFYLDQKSKKFSYDHAPLMFVSLTALVPFVFFFLLSFKTHVWPHWPVVSYGLFVLPIGYWFSQKEPIKRIPKLMMGMFAFDLILLSVLLFSSPGIIPMQKIYWNNYRLAGQIAEFKKIHPGISIISDYHGSVAQISYYGKVEAFMPTGLLAVEDGTWGKGQFKRWKQVELKRGQDLIVFTKPGSDLYQKAKKNFVTVTPLPEWKLNVMEEHLKGKMFYRFIDFKLPDSKI